MTKIDWPGLMRVGLRDLGLSPEVFWSLTPAELQMMLGEAKQSGPLLSSGLDALMAAYPDK
jgi:uncharacterized phage protein (TIGR02216 family)